MKKFLFTLAALCTFGLACAEPAPVMGFRNADNEQITEISLAPGESMELKIAIMEMSMNMVSGVQAQWRMFDAEHNNIDYAITNKANPKKAYGPAFAATWFDAIEYGTAEMGMPGLAIGKATPKENIYRILATNTEYNMCFFKIDPFDGVTERCPQNIGKFTMAASPEWDEEFATFELDLEYTLWNQCPGMDPAVFEEAWNTEPMILTVKNANFVPPTPEPIPLTGDILIGDADEEGYVTIEYTGDEEGLTIVACIDGVPVEIVDGKIFLGAYGEAVITVEVSGEGYITKTAEKTVNWEEPVTPPAQTPNPVIDVTPGDDCYIFTAVGEGEVTLWVDQQEVENPYTVNRTEVDQTVKLTAVAHVDGQIDGTVTGEWIVPALESVVPEVTANPVISYVVNDDAVVITATGEGNVILYINGEQVENPATITRGEADVVVVVTATAQEEGKLISETVEAQITIPAVAGPEPPVVQEGIYLILIDQYNVEHPYKLNEGEDGSYTTTVTLEYDPWGSFAWDPSLSDEENELNRPDVPFYFLVDGVRYGANGDFIDTYLGNAMMNPLTNEYQDGYYTVPVGFAYTLGVAVVGENDYYVYAAVSKKTGAEELNADKTVAGVRYFNMAGQEMQEANGMTIVVTTYTDGTTSTSKVMK